MAKRRPSAKYLARAGALAEAIDIAVDAELRHAAALRAELEALSISELRKAFEVWTTINSQRQPTKEEEDRYYLSMYLWTKKSALAPEPQFANLGSLAYHVENVFTHWNEDVGPDVDRFWQFVAERGLPFERKDKIHKILNRGKIQNDVEYHAVTDAIVILQQTGKITVDEAQRLSDMLAAFEKRGQRRRKKSQ
jgi:hypothetical protein